MKKTTGVIIARFQTPYLHEGHQALINSVTSKHNKAIVILGMSPIVGSRRNPYDFYTREKMLKAAFPTLVILPLRDHPSDHEWSLQLDELLRSTFPNEEFKLYGSRDSFITAYSGRYETIDLQKKGEHNATAIRNEFADKVHASEDFRAGVLYALYGTYPKVYPTVDVVVFRHERKEVLLGKKQINQKWRLVGGFVDPEDEDYESAARRELNEECGPIEVDQLRYEKSFKVDDWRYRSETDKIITLLFSCDFVFGQPEAKDDIIDTAWFDLKTIENKMKEGEITPEHLPIFDYLLKKYKY